MEIGNGSNQTKSKAVSRRGAAPLQAVKSPEHAISLGFRDAGAPRLHPVGSTGRARIEAAQARPSVWISFLRYLAGRGHGVPATAVSRELAVPLDLSLVRKTTQTMAKHMTDKEAKIGAIEAAYSVTKPLSGEVVVLVDDLVLSGATLEVIGSKLKHAGAVRVIALTATKAHKGLAN